MTQNPLLFTLLSHVSKPLLTLKHQIIQVTVKPKAEPSADDMRQFEKMGEYLLFSEVPYL